MHQISTTRIKTHQQNQNPSKITNPSIQKFMQNPDLLDHIGVESNIDFQPDVDFTTTTTTTTKSSRIRKQKSSNTKEFPPPIPCLARTGNLPSHMPFVMKRYYTTDGRLIIQEQRVERHEYFQAHRFNGRLVLNLIPLDERDEKMEGGDLGRDDRTVEEEVFVEPSRYNRYSPCGGIGVVMAAFAPSLHI